MMELMHPMVHNKINMMDMVEQAAPVNSLIVENGSHSSVAPVHALNCSIRWQLAHRPRMQGELSQRSLRLNNIFQ